MTTSATQSAYERVGSSFRDPAGKLIQIEGRIFRLVNPSGVRGVRAFLDSKVTRELQEQRHFVQTRVLDPAEASMFLRQVDLPIPAGSLVLEHQRVDFPSFPYEWPAEMLHAAGTLTVELACAYLDEGIGLKDATPYNVLFDGPCPLFVDVLSFEERDPLELTWLAYGQLVRTFLLPLALNKYCSSAPASLFLARRDGLEPEEVYRQLSLLLKLRPPFLTLTTLPRWLASWFPANKSACKQATNAEQAKFILSLLLRRTRRMLRRLEPRTSTTSNWSGYSSLNSYATEGRRAKRTFVEQALREFRPKRLLDVGSNLGEYGEMAARLDCAVVAVDSDPVVAGQLWRRARSEKLNILPLVVDFARPSPAVGWRNQESTSFLERARGQFDMVFMLAVVHHLLIKERVPLQEIVDLSAELTTNILVVEFVPPDDPMFRQLARGQEKLHADLDRTSFEDACRKRYFIVRSLQLEGSSRRLYVLRKR
jgi:2-polyprenyl-3-methyl-5-hydroxy-6-metoxy-1,4-benzoquinol methylase